ARRRGAAGERGPPRGMARGARRVALRRHAPRPEAGRAGSDENPRGAPRPGLNGHDLDGGESMRRVIAALGLVAVSATGAFPQQPVNLAFATLDTGSAWYVYGATMAEVLRRALPRGSNIDVKPRAGGVGNPRLVAKNETPLGLGFTVTNRWAYEGKEAYDAKLDSLRVPLGYAPATRPANAFKGQTETVRTVGFPTVLITNKHLSEPIAYTITKAVLENKDALVRGHAGLAEFDPATAWQSEKVGIPLH